MIALQKDETKIWLYVYIMIDWLIDWLTLLFYIKLENISLKLSVTLDVTREISLQSNSQDNPNAYNGHLRQASGMLMTYPNLISWAFILKLYVACRSLQDFITFQNAFLDSKKVARYLHIHMMRNQELYIIFVS